MLPVLVVLFLASYGLMSLLIVEQGRTIDTQRYLIQELFHDSTQLSALKGKAIQQQQADAKARSQAPQPSQSAPQGQSQSEKNAAGKRRKPLQKPPEDTADRGSFRRSLILL